MSSGLFSPPRVNRAVDGWEQRSLRSMLSARSERNRSDLPLLTVARERGVFVRSAEDANHNAIPEDLSNYKVARRGDLVINKMKAWQGSLGLAPVDGIVSPAYFVFSADFAVPEFGEYLLRSKPYVAKFAAASDGVRIGQWDLDIARMREIRVRLPAPGEQTAIVKYLAHANARIDNAIAAKRRLIALLEEQSLAVAREILSGRSTSHCGFDDGHRVPWIGKVPSKWGVAPLKRVARLRSGAGFPVNRQGHPGEELPFFRVSDMNLPQNLEWLATCESTVSRAEAADLGAVVFDRETIVFPKVGGALLTNKRRLLERPSCIDNNMMGATFFGLERDYAFEIMQLIDMADIVKPGPVPAVGQGDIGAIQVPIPPSSEQLHLVSVLKAEGAEVNDTIRAASAEITLLQEFRTRLVADVVTGQVDVRAVAETLPDPSMPDVSLDEDGIDLDDLYGHEDD